MVSGTDLAERTLSLVYDAIHRAAEVTVELYRDSLKLDEDALARRRAEFGKYLDAIRRTAELAEALSANGPGEFRARAEDLRKQVHYKHRKIEPPDLDRRPEVPIDELYTPQAMRPDERFRTGYLSSIITTQFVAQFRRAVVLGSPGGGKSTLARYTCFELSRQGWSPSLRRPIPLLVTLRKWDPDNESLLDQLYATANRFYQIRLSDDFLEVLLGARLVLPVFDGLDEVLDLGGRRTTVDAIDAFCNRYPAVRILASSRYIGYEQAVLPQEDFDVMVLSEFSTPQVDDYSRRWFRFGAGLSTEDASNTADSFLHQSQSVDDVRRNPLLLALMCILYRGHRYIPQNRPKLYEECARLLFRDWDLHRGISLNLAFESHVEDCVQHLAHWIFGNDEREKGVSEEVLIDEAQAFFLEWLYTDPMRAREAAKEFVKYCRGRAWILSATGSAPGAPDVFQFTHRTFLEHFTGTYLSRTATSPEALADELAGHIEDPQWDVVAQVALYRQKEDHRGASDLIFRRLMDRADASRSPHWLRHQVVDFLARCLAIVAPRPAVVSQLVWMCLDIDNERLMSYMGTLHTDGDALAVLLVSPSLDDARRENVTTIEDAAGSWLTARLAGPQGIEHAVGLLSAISVQSSDDGAWAGAVARWRPLLESEADQRARDSAENALNMVASGLLPPSKAYQLHGVRLLFANYRDWAGRWQPALGPRIIIDTLGTEKAPPHSRQVLSDLAVLVEAGLPLRGHFQVKRDDLGEIATPSLWVSNLAGVDTHDTSILGLVFLCCIWEEIALAADVPGPRDVLGPQSLADLDGVKYALERRSDDSWDAVHGVQSIGLPQHGADLVIAWAEGRISFTAGVHVEP